MSDDPLVERIVGRAMRVAGGGTLHPALVAQRVLEAAEARLREGKLPRRFVVVIGGEDAATVAAAGQDLRPALQAMLDGLAERHHLKRPQEWEVSFEHDAGARPGAVAVRVDSGGPSPRRASNPANPTRPIRRHQGPWLAASGGTRYRVAHTPFIIGREAGCDLVLSDLSVSRRHAELATDPSGTLVIRDLGSRNGVFVNGARVAEARLAAGDMVGVGAATFIYEVTA